MSSSDRIAKAAGFLLHSPPGEVDDVFNDIRGIVNDDDALQQHIGPVLASSNMQQFLAVDVPNQQSVVLITPYNQVGEDRYLDPNTRTVFHFDHLRREASDVQECDALLDTVADTEDLRAGLQKALQAYVTSHYASGTVSVFSHEGSVVSCIVSNRFSPGNYWNGSWRAVWSFDPVSGQLNGSTKVRVHYFEEGNVQLDTQSDFAADIPATKGNNWAQCVADRIACFEGEFQQAINDGYAQLAEKTFRGLRRTLPVTRNKVDWEKIANYKIGGELAGADSGSSN